MLPVFVRDSLAALRPSSKGHGFEKKKESEITTSSPGSRHHQNDQTWQAQMGVHLERMPDEEMPKRSMRREYTG